MIFFGRDAGPVSAVSTVEAEESRLHGVAVRCRLGGVSGRGSVGGGGRSRETRRGVTVTWVGLLGGHWSSSSSRGGQHELLAWLHKHKNTQEMIY